jgi:hypothetical protein
MAKFLLRVILSIFILIVLFGLLLLPTIADKIDTPSSKNKGAFLEASPLISAQITFTPVVTIYLPIMFASDSPTEQINIDIELPNGLIYQVGDRVEVIITVSSVQGIDNFTWGAFVGNLSPITGGNKECNGLSQCKIEGSFFVMGPGDFFIGVEALDVKGKTETERIDFKVE